MMNRPSTRAIVAFGIVAGVIFIFKPDTFYDQRRNKMKPACVGMAPEIKEVEGLGKLDTLCTPVPWYMASAGASALVLLFS